MDDCANYSHARNPHRVIVHLDLDCFYCESLVVSLLIPFQP